MNCIRIGDLCGAYDGRNIQVTLSAGWRADAYRFIRESDM
jgi:hypothetical protein